MSPNLLVFILVVVFVVGWFAIGTQYNVRKGHQAMRWLQEGLPVIGEKTTLRWLGSSVVELKIQEAKPPFSHAEVLFVLEPRDVSIIWAFARLRGRRDATIGSVQCVPWSLDSTTSTRAVSRASATSAMITVSPRVVSAVA